MKHRHSSAVRALCSLAGMLFALSLFAADADVTGLVPTIWWDFETQPDAAGLTAANKGSASVSFSTEGTKTYQAGVTNGWALDTSAFTPYSGAGSFSTAGGAYTVSLVMNLGTTKNGITLNLRNETGERDLIVRRGSTAGSLVVGCDTWKVATRHNLTATFEDDSTYHLVSVVVEDTGISLYMDGTFVDSTTDFTPWTDTGRASRLQFGSHLSGVPSSEAKYGGCIDDLRIHDAALTPAQMKAIAAEYGLASLDGYIAVAPSGEPTVGTGSFRAPFVLLLSEGDVAEAAIVYGTDAALSAPTTNVVGSALPAGAYAASLSGLASGTTYWWKLVASNGVEWAETDAASFRTLDEIVPTDYARRIPAVLSGYAGTDTLTNFPVLVKLAAGTPAGFDYADCAEDGADIRFASPDGTVLPHEIDTWNTNGESFVWVKIPAISGTATAFSMYYAASDPAALPPVDPHDVWTAAGHRAVWHFAADATESAQGLVASTATGTPSYENDGAVGKCWQSAGAAWLQYANDASWSALGAGSTLTISTWAKFDSTSYSYNRILSTMSTWEQPAGYELTVQDDVNEITVGSSGKSQYQKIVSPGPSDKLVYLTAVYNADRYADLYVNGVLKEHMQLNQVVQPTEAMTVACVGNGVNVWNGKLDELRLHAAAESADWVKACYDTMAAPTSFVTLSPAESTDPDLPRFGALSASDANGVATFTVPLTEPGYGGEVPTAVSVFYGTDGETWTELSLGSTNETATLTASASGFAVGVRYLWYAVATATSGGTPKTTVSQPQSFVARAFDPTGNYKFFTATVVWDGAPAENLPFLLRISEGGVNGFDYDDVTASGLEILDADGQLLPFEIDTWNTNGESLVWVLPPVYENGATVTVRYGAPFANAPLPATNVWTAYVAVWHMNEILVDSESGKHYTPDSSASGWHAYKSDEADTVLSPVTTAPGASAHPTPLTGTAMNIAYGAGKSSSSLGGFCVPADQTSSTTLNGPGFTFSAIVNSQQPANNGRCRVIAFGNSYNDKANFPVGSDNIYCMGSDNHKKANPKGATGWVCAAGVFNSPLSKIYADGVCLSASNEGKPNLASITLTKGIGLGCFTDGKQCLDGYLDEARIRNAASTADWIAAEYHTMADGAVSFSSVSSSDTSVPVLGTPSVASNPDGSFTVSVEVSENTPASIVCIVGGTDYAMTTADASLPATYSVVIDDLPNGTHVATVRATATSGTVVSSTCPTAFHVGSLTIVKQSDADEGALTPGVFRISRADADSTGLPALSFDVAFSGDGLAAIANPGISTATIPAGAAYVDIAVTPVPNDEVNEDLELVLTVAGTHVGQSSTASLTVLDAGFDLAVRYVATDGNDANSGGTPESPKKTIAAAVAAVSPIAPSRPCTIHVAPGLYPISSPIVVTNAIHIFGDDPDPSRTVVSNTLGAGDQHGNQRVFTINHPDVLIANLAMQDGSVWGDWSGGGNFLVDAAGGTVSNCIVEAGHVQWGGHVGGGGARMAGGLVTHTVFRKNYTVTGSSQYGDGAYRAGVLMLMGNACAENCLLVDNPQSAATTIARLDGNAMMRNCSIVDSKLSQTSDLCKVFTPLRINSANATVLNTVIAGVTNKIDGAACPPSGSVAKFQNGAFDGDATGLPEGTITGTAAEFFNDYANGDYTLNPTGVLVNAGINYDGMASVDLAGKKRKSGKYIDIGCYECQKEKGFFILLR